MYTPLSKLQSDWLAKNPFKEFVPHWLNPPVRPVVLMPADPAAAQIVRTLRLDAEEQLNTVPDGKKSSSTFKLRQRIAGQVTDYLQRNLDALVQLDCTKLVDLLPKLSGCHHSGMYGHDADGRLAIAWDVKCAHAMLCPHCARQEQRRLVRHYKKPMMEWVKGRCTRRIHKAVVTWPNVPAGELSPFMRRMFVEYAKLSKKFSSLKGQSVSMETPLAAAGDWNLHLNALMLVDGAFHWGEFRDAWHKQTRHLFPGYEEISFQMNLRQLNRYDDAELDRELREQIKYPVKHIATEKTHHAEQARRSARNNHAELAGGSGQVVESGTGADVGVGRAQLGAARAEDADAGAGGRVRVDRDAIGAPAGSAQRNTAAGAAGADGGCDACVCALVASDGAAESGEAVAYRARAGDGVGDDGGHRCHGRSQEPSGRRAPSLIDWPAERFAEWWHGHQRFRRTRSYGVIFGKQRAALIAEDEELPRTPVTWRGRIQWDARSKVYTVEAARPVSSILDDKSVGASSSKRDRFGPRHGVDPPPGIDTRVLSSGPGVAVPIAGNKVMNF